MDTILHILAVYALTFAFMNGKVAFITDYIQRWGFFREMLACSLCLGTEIGLWSYFAIHAWAWPAYYLVDNFIFGLACGAVCLIVDRILHAIDVDP